MGCGDSTPAPTDAATDLSNTDVSNTDVSNTDVSNTDVATDTARNDITTADATSDVTATDAADVTATDASADVTATDVVDAASDGGMPANLTVPAGNTRLLQVAARGVQIYTCAAMADAGVSDAGTAYAWTLRAPEATLYDADGNLVGTHFLGPNWRTVDGSQVTGAVQERAPSPTGDAIPWLLLRATMNAGAGLLSRVTFVQRLSTRGGLAPATGCDASSVGTERAVDYSADYVFWGAAGDGGVERAGVPTVLNLPETGLTVLRRAAARGDQIYRCDAVSPDAGTSDASTTDASVGPTYQWTFVAPDATLYDSEMRMIGTHGAGPFWRTTDGNQVNGAVAQRADAPVAGAIPWLLLRATTTVGTTGLGRVRFVHRVATTGGVAPSSGCDLATVGSQRRVPYTADYYFWTAP
jgi:Protein of unknown function (DUF3455)